MTYIVEIADRRWEECKHLRCRPQGRSDSGEFVFFLEFVDTTGSIDNLLGTGEEGVTLVTDIYRELRFVTSYGKFVSACTAHLTIHIFRMNSFFHDQTFLGNCCCRWATNPFRYLTYPSAAFAGVAATLYGETTAIAYDGSDFRVGIISKIV